MGGGGPGRPCLWPHPRPPEWSRIRGPEGSSCQHEPSALPRDLPSLRRPAPEAFHWASHARFRFARGLNDVCMVLSSPPPTHDVLRSGRSVTGSCRFAGVTPPAPPVLTHSPGDRHPGAPRFCRGGRTDSGGSAHSSLCAREHARRGLRLRVGLLGRARCHCGACPVTWDEGALLWVPPAPRARSPKLGVGRPPVCPADGCAEACQSCFN